MAKLNNFVVKVFGSGAGGDQIGVFGSLFAGSEDTTTNPDTAQSLSNWLTGWFGAAIGGNAPAIEDMNAAMYVPSYRLAYQQQMGIPEWNTGVSYQIGSYANVSGILDISLTDDNLGHDPTTNAVNWKMYGGGVKPGAGMDYWGDTLPSGYVWGAGRTVGNVSSNATERANDDTLDLFIIFWARNSTLFPIYTSAGVLSTRGANAAADFAANKAVAICDKRERVSVGLGTMGGTTDPGRLTSAANGFDPTVLGAAGGENVHTQTEAEMVSHTHVQNSHNHTQNSHTHSLIVPNASYNVNFPDNSFNAAQASSGTNPTNTTNKIATATATNQVATAVNQSTGGGAAFNVVQPTIVCNYIVKL